MPNEGVKTFLNGEFECHYQPMVSPLAPHEKLYYEIILRKKEMPLPYDPYADYLQQIHDQYLSAALIQEVFLYACRYFSPEEHFSLNLPIEAILDKCTYDIIVSTIREAHIGEQIIFEVIGASWKNDYPKVEPLIKELKSLGVRFAIDGFVADPMLFETIELLYIDMIKIDGYLFKKWVESQWSGMIIDSIVQYADENGLIVIAKDIDTGIELHRAYGLGIEWVQGDFMEPLSVMTQRRY